MTVHLDQSSFGGELEGPRLLITGGVHGDEFEPVLAIWRLIQLFAGDGAPALKGRLTLAPVVNEAAYQRGSRCADDDLDLARTCPGLPDGSITEQTAHALSNLIRSSEFYIDLHTGGAAFTILPMSGYVLHADAKILDQQRTMARAFNLPIMWGTSAALKGRSLSVARDAGIPAIYCEYLGGGRCHAAGVDDYLAGCLNVMSALEMIDRPQPQPRIEQWVEDARPESGHLQACNPAPLTGFFEPCVRLGDRVQQGDALGTVWDSNGGQQTEIRSRQRGVVLVLRTVARVLQGESIGVVLETGPAGSSELVRQS